MRDVSEKSRCIRCVRTMITRGEERRAVPSGANSAMRALLGKGLFASFVNGRFLKKLFICVEQRQKCEEAESDTIELACFGAGGASVN